MSQLFFQLLNFGKYFGVFVSCSNRIDFFFVFCLLLGSFFLKLFRADNFDMDGYEGRGSVSDSSNLQDLKPFGSAPTGLL